LVVGSNGNFPNRTPIGSGVSVLLGKGDGTFQTPQYYPVGLPFSVAVADVNGDGKPDLVVPNGGNYDPKTRKLLNEGVKVFLGKGDGSFGPPQTFVAGSFSEMVAVADVNGDGKPDIVDLFGNSEKFPGGGVGVLLGKGDGTFGPPQTFVAGFDPAAVADVN